MSIRRRRPRGIEVRRHRNGRLSYRVRWTDPAGQRRSEEFDSLDDAKDFKASLRLAKRGGRLRELSAGRDRLADFVEHQWWPRFALIELARNTQLVYASIWNKHLLRRIGHLELRQLTPAIVAELRADLEEDGVGRPTIAKALSMLQAVCREAVTWGELRANPVASVRKPAAVSRAVEPLAPRQVVRIIDAIGGETALLVELLAWAGLRPEEALALQWRHVGRETLLIEQVNVDGHIRPGTKVSGKPRRSIDLIPPLAEALAAQRRAGGVLRHGNAFVLTRADGEPWRGTDLRNWRRRKWQPACVEAGVATLTIQRVDGRERRSYTGPPPYWLRHSYASGLLRAGMPPAEIAEQMGHDVQTLLSTYSHVIAELRGKRPKPFADQVAEAKARVSAQAKRPKNAPNGRMADARP